MANRITIKKYTKSEIDFMLKSYDKDFSLAGRAIWNSHFVKNVDPYRSMTPHLYRKYIASSKGNYISIVGYENFNCTEVT